MFLIEFAIKNVSYKCLVINMQNREFETEFHTSNLNYRRIHCFVVI